MSKLKIIAVRDKLSKMRMTKDPTHSQLMELWEMRSEIRSALTRAAMLHTHRMIREKNSKASEPKDLTKVLDCVAFWWQVPAQKIGAAGRFGVVTEPRHAYCLLAYLSGGHKLRDICAFVGRGNHTTAINSLKRCLCLAQTEPIYMDRLIQCIDALGIGLTREEVQKAGSYLELSEIVIRRKKPL